MMMMQEIAGLELTTISKDKSNIEGYMSQRSKGMTTEHNAWIGLSINLSANHSQTTKNAM